METLPQNLNKQAPQYTKALPQVQTGPKTFIKKVSLDAKKEKLKEERLNHRLIYQKIFKNYLEMVEQNQFDHINEKIIYWISQILQYYPKMKTWEQKGWSLLKGNHFWEMAAKFIHHFPIPQGSLSYSSLEKNFIQNYGVIFIHPQEGQVFYKKAKEILAFFESHLKQFDKKFIVVAPESWIKGERNLYLDKNESTHWQRFSKSISQGNGHLWVTGSYIHLDLGDQLKHSVGIFQKGKTLKKYSARRFSKREEKYSKTLNISFEKGRRDSLFLLNKQMCSIELGQDCHDARTRWDLILRGLNGVHLQLGLSDNYPHRFTGVNQGGKVVHFSNGDLTSTVGSRPRGEDNSWYQSHWKSPKSMSTLDYSIYL